jgi:hypothetical protein
MNKKMRSGTVAPKPMATIAHKIVNNRQRLSIQNKPNGNDNPQDSQRLAAIEDLKQPETQQFPTMTVGRQQ